jgi:uncharacterized protein YdaU (DUF1376 family)
MTTAPYMRLYIGDYLADTIHLSRGEHGAYLLLLMAMWRAGGKLPAQDAKLARIAKCTAKEWEGMRETILAFFQRRGGTLTHKRLARELAIYTDKIVRASKGGKASAVQKAKENNGKNAKQLQANFNQSEPEPDSRTEPLQGSSSTSDASEPARPEGAVSSRPRLTVVPKAEPKPVRPATAAERRAEIAAILAKPKPEAPPPAPAETQAQMVERLRKSIVPGGAA